MAAFVLLPPAIITISMNSKTENEEVFDAGGYSEIEIGRMTDLEYALAKQRVEAFLHQEREEQKTFDREFTQELEQLLATLGKNKMDSDADPPGWPDF